MRFDLSVDYTEEVREEENDRSQQHMEHQCVQPPLSI